MYKHTEAEIVTNGAAVFIVLEGIDGAGTTTQTARLVDYLAGRKRRALATQEPSRGPMGRLLREILQGGHLTPAGQPVSGGTMALLFAADRRDHLHREIEPALTAGTDVVSDRYLLSSLAYQAEESAREWVLAIARGVRTPDLTILVDLPVEVAARRRKQAKRVEERYDADQFLERVAESYRALARSAAPELGQVVVVDGDQGFEEVSLAIQRAVQPILAARS